MSAAATAAGYLYASGRLRGRNGRDDHQDNEHHRDNDRHYGAEQPRKPAVKVAVYQAEAQPAPGAPRKTPKIQYRTRRWKPE